MPDAVVICTNGSEVVVPPYGGSSASPLVIGIVVPSTFLALVLALMGLYYLCLNVEANRYKQNRKAAPKHGRPTKMRNDRQVGMSRLPAPNERSSKAMPGRYSVLTSTKRQLRAGSTSQQRPNYQDLLRDAANTVLSVSTNSVSVNSHGWSFPYRFVYVTPPATARTPIDPAPDYATVSDSDVDATKATRLHHNTPTDCRTTPSPTHTAFLSASPTMSSSPSRAAVVGGAASERHTTASTYPSTLTSHRSATPALVYDAATTEPPSRASTTVHYVTNASSPEVIEMIASEHNKPQLPVCDQILVCNDVMNCDGASSTSRHQSEVCSACREWLTTHHSTDDVDAASSAGVSRRTDYGASSGGCSQGSDTGRSQDVHKWNSSTQGSGMQTSVTIYVPHDVASQNALSNSAGRASARTSVKGGAAQVPRHNQPIADTERLRVPSVYSRSLKRQVSATELPRGDVRARQADVTLECNKSVTQRGVDNQYSIDTHATFEWDNYQPDFRESMIGVPSSQYNHLFHTQEQWV